MWLCAGRALLSECHRGIVLKSECRQTCMHSPEATDRGTQNSTAVAKNWGPEQSATGWSPPREWNRTVIISLSRRGSQAMFLGQNA